MTTYFISRHPGAIEWAAEEGFAVDKLVRHLDVSMIQAGDVVLGSLPVNMAAAICSKGARYLHLSLDLPSELRGKELTPEDMRRCGARLEEYIIQRKGYGRGN